MITYHEACEQADFDRSNYPTREYRYVAYKSGTATYFDDKHSANQHSKLVERVQVNEEDYKKEVEKYRAKEQKAFDIWYNSLREEYSNISVQVFNHCYSMAYERGHSTGYDEVANCMIDTIDFAEKIIAAVK